MNFLIVNDDGFDAVGIKVLQRFLENYGDVYVVAPQSNRSATSHAITINKPLQILKQSEREYKISGMPADCSKIGLKYLFNDIKFDLVCSGINNGPNLGFDVFYSGTFSAAREAILLGVPALAFSLDKEGAVKEEYEYVLSCFKPCFDHLIKDLTLDHVVNINFPKGEIKGVKETVLGQRQYTHEYDVLDENGDEQIIIDSSKIKIMKQLPNSDIQAVIDKHISISYIGVTI